MILSFILYCGKCQIQWHGGGWGGFWVKPRIISKLVSGPRPLAFVMKCIKQNNIFLINFISDFSFIFSFSKRLKRKKNEQMWTFLHPFFCTRRTDLSLACQTWDCWLPALTVACAPFQLYSSPTQHFHNMVSSWLLKACGQRTPRNIIFLFCPSVHPVPVLKCLLVCVKVWVTHICKC